MKLMLLCVNKKRLETEYIQVKFKAGSCEFKINVKETLAEKYELGKSYTFEVS